jgi:hypothetical protein
VNWMSRKDRMRAMIVSSRISISQRSFVNRVELVEARNSIGVDDSQGCD